MHALGMVLSLYELMCTFPYNCRVFGWEVPANPKAGHGMDSPVTREGLGCTAWSAGAGCWPPKPGNPALTFPVLVTSSYASLMLVCTKLGQPVCHGMQIILLFLFLGGFWHLKASSFVTGEPQLISCFTHIPRIVLCLVSRLCCVYLKSGLL